MRKAKTCLVVTPDRGDVDAAIRQEAMWRGWELELRHDPVMAMAEICLREKVAASRALASGEPEASIALVVVHPASSAHGAQFLRAASTYLRQTSIYAFTEDGLTRVAGSDEADPVRAIASSELDESPDPAVSDRRTDREHDGRHEGEDSVTAEELAMLLRGTAGDS